MAKYHKIGQGECLAVLALQYGFTDYHAIWDDPKNALLNSKRQNPNILAPGDILFIPDKKDKEESRGTSQAHNFQVGGATVKFRTIIKDALDRPVANAPYTLRLPDQMFTGVTGGDGLLEQTIPLAVQSGELSLTDLGFTWTLHFGHLDPVDTTAGVQGRLKSLGYDPGAVDGTENDALTAALKAFQKDNGLPASGTCDAATQSKLQEKHGC